MAAAQAQREPPLTVRDANNAMRALESDSSAVPSSDEEKMRLLQKIKDAGNGPEFAARRIRELDKMVKRLLQARSDCQAEIDQAEEKLRVLDKRVVAVQERYDTVKRRLDQRREMRDRIAQQLEQSMGHLQGVITSTRQSTLTTRKLREHHFSKDASESLAASRGFTTDRKAGLYGKVTPLTSTSSTLGQTMGSTTGRAEARTSLAHAQRR